MCSILEPSALNCGLLKHSTGPRTIYANLPDNKMYLDCIRKCRPPPPRISRGMVGNPKLPRWCYDQASLGNMAYYHIIVLSRFAYNRFVLPLK